MLVFIVILQYTFYLYYSSSYLIRKFYVISFNQIQLDEGVRIVKKTSIILALILSLNLSGAVFAETPIEKSIETFTQEIERNPNASLAYSNRASMRFLKQDIQGAISDFDKAIQLNPNNPELYLNRGYIKQLIGDLDGSMADYNLALRINPNFAYAYNNRGVLKVALNDIDGAMNDYAKALSINSKYADVYYNRANLKYMLNDNKGALEDYNIAIELNPKDAEAYNNRGVVKKRMNFNVGALSDYSQAIALNPNDSIAYANRGRLKKLYFDNEGAAIDLDQAVALAEKQIFIKNVKPLLSKESYIAAIPTASFPVNSLTKPTIAGETIAYNKTPVGQAVKQVSVSSQTNTKALISPTQLQQPVKQTVNAQQSKPMPAPVEEKLASANTISAGVATVQAPVNPVITTTAIKKSPTTNVKLAESYYIRGLQKCVLRDLQGAIADLNKAIENNSKYADAYYYRAAIRKELGDTEGFRKDYSIAIQINPSLQSFNDSNCLSLVGG